MTIARETLLSVMEMQTVSPMETSTSVSATLVSVVMARSATVSMTLCKIKYLMMNLILLLPKYFRDLSSF